MAEAITLNIGNGAATLAYNEIVYSFTVGSSTADSDETTNYTWSLLLLMNPYCIQSYILPYIAYTLYQQVHLCILILLQLLAIGV